MTRQRVVIVLGMHRSGTSAITRGLSALGVELGTNLIPAVAGNNDRGFWEDVDFAVLNEDVLAAVGSRWDSVRPIDPAELAGPSLSALRIRAIELLTRKLGKHPLSGFKDPRVCRLLPFWQPVFRHLDLEDLYLVAVRNPLSVAKSLAVRDGFASEKAFLLWLGHVLPAITHTAEQRRVVVDYDLLLADPRGQMGRIAVALGMSDPGSLADALEAYCSDFLSEDLRHTVFKPSALLEDARVPTLVLSAYEWLLRCAKDDSSPQDPAARAEWERIDSQFRSLSPIYGLLEEQLQARVEAERLWREASVEANRLNQVLVEREQQLAALAGALSDRDTLIGSLHGTVSARDADITGLARTLAERTEQLTGSQAELGHVRDALAERDRRIAELSARVDVLDNHIRVLVNTRSWRLTRPIREARTRVVALRRTVRAWAGLRSRKTPAHAERRNGPPEHVGPVAPAFHPAPVVLVTHDCRPYGAQLITLGIARLLRRWGHDVAVVALEGGDLLQDFAAVATVIEAPAAAAEHLRRELTPWRRRGAHAITSTVVSGSVVPLLKDLGFQVLSLVHELPGVIHDMGQQVNAVNVAELADAVVFPAELVRQRFCEAVRVPTGTVHVRPQGVLRRNRYRANTAEARRLVCERHALAPGAGIVLAAGHADARKGADRFVEVAAEVTRGEPGSVFIWIGDLEPDMERAVQYRVRQLGLEHRVLFVGFQPDPDPYYAAASVFALTSREDPFPNAVLEAADVGVPVVAFEGASGAGDVILDRGGCLAAADDIASFATCVATLLNAPRRDERPLGGLRQYVLDLLHMLSGFPRVSVVVPNYNCAPYLEERLDTVLGQTLPVYELILLDDGSTDESAEMLERFATAHPDEATLVRRDSNSGSVFGQWREGVARCSGDLVWIAEADDRASADFAARLSPHFADPRVVLVFCQSRRIDASGAMLAPDSLAYTSDVSDRWVSSYRREGREEIRDALTIKNTIPNASAVLFRRDALAAALRDIGDDLLEYRVAGDWLVYLHVLLRGDIVYDAAAMNSHRIHANSVIATAPHVRHLDEVCAVQKLAQAFVTPPPAVRAKADAYIASLREHFDALGTGTTSLQVDT